MLHVVWRRRPGAGRQVSPEVRRGLRHQPARFATETYAQSKSDIYKNRQTCTSSETPFLCLEFIALRYGAYYHLPANKMAIALTKLLRMFKLIPSVHKMQSFFSSN